MKCLRCGNKLLNVKERTLFSRISYDICEKCGGLWLDKGELDKIARHTYGSVELGSVVDLTEKIEPKETEILSQERLHAHYRCLNCKDPTMAKMRFMGDSSILLDYCRGCGAIWLDGGDLDRINGYIKWFDENSIESDFGYFLKHVKGNFWHRIKVVQTDDDVVVGKTQENKGATSIPIIMVALMSFLLSSAKASADDFWSYWGDGKAELSGYKLVQPRYGQKRNGKAVLIFVTETHSEKEKVKIEGDPFGVPARDKFSVMKLNDVRTFQTGIYDYKVMTSVFSRVDEKFGLSKVSLGVQEWCGHVYHQMIASSKGIEETLHSYFGGEADQAGHHAIPSKAVFEDNIPILIRELRGSWLKPGERAEFPGAPSLLALRFQHKPFAWGKIMVQKSAAPETIPSILSEKKAVRWTVSTPLRGTYTYFVEADEPHRILKWTSNQGESGELTGTIRLDYWKRHDEGDESYLEQLFPK